jgi:excisionase family DNA binding protein
LTLHDRFGTADRCQPVQTEVNMVIQFETEAFVTPEEAAVFLRYSPITVKRLAREGRIPAHSVTNGVRKRWRFLISELATTMQKEVSLNHHPRR